MSVSTTQSKTEVSVPIQARLSKWMAPSPTPKVPSVMAMAPAGKNKHYNTELLVMSLHEYVHCSSKKLLSFTDSTNGLKLGREEGKQTRQRMFVDPLYVRTPRHAWKKSPVLTNSGVSELPAHHISIIDVPVVVTDCAPVLATAHLHSTLAGHTLSIGKSHRTSIASCINTKVSVAYSFIHIHVRIS